MLRFPVTGPKPMGPDHGLDPLKTVEPNLLSFTDGYAGCFVAVRGHGHSWGGG